MHLKPVNVPSSGTKLRDGFGILNLNSTLNTDNVFFFNENTYQRNLKFSPSPQFRVYKEIYHRTIMLKYNGIRYK